MIVGVEQVETAINYVDAFWLGAIAATAAAFVAGVRAMTRVVVRQIIDGVDERTNGRIERMLTHRLDEYAEAQAAINKDIRIYLAEQLESTNRGVVGLRAKVDTLLAHDAERDRQGMRYGPPEDE